MHYHQVRFYLQPTEVIYLLVDLCFGRESRRGRYDRCAVVVAPSASDDLELTSLLQPALSKTGTFDDNTAVPVTLCDYGRSSTIIALCVLDSSCVVSL